MPEAPRHPRLSFTRKHTDSGIVAELLTLLETVTADGTISEAEAREIGAWLEENGGESSIPGIEFLRTTVREILADGRVTEAERVALYKAVEKVLPPEARRDARERRTAIESLEKARTREKEREQKRQISEARERDRSILRLNFMVRGILYEGRAGIVERFASQSQLVFLVREPDNPKDPNAVRVRLETGHDIGYVPREDAPAVPKLLDLGFPYRARITKILRGRRAPIPVVEADIYGKDASVEKVFPHEAPEKTEPPDASGGCLILAAGLFGLLFLIRLVAC
jgi:hypothetical protein